jgi:hypothetical protein
MTGPRISTLVASAAHSRRVQPPQERLEFLGCRLAVRRGGAAPSYHVLPIHLFDLFRKSSFSATTSRLPDRPRSSQAEPR